MSICNRKIDFTHRRVKRDGFETKLPISHIEVVIFSIVTDIRSYDKSPCMKRCGHRETCQKFFYWNYSDCRKRTGFFWLPLTSVVDVRQSGRNPCRLNDWFAEMADRDSVKSTLNPVSRNPWSRGLNDSSLRPSFACNASRLWRAQR